MSWCLTLSRVGDSVLSTGQSLPWYPAWQVYRCDSRISDKVCLWKRILGGENYKVAYLTIQEISISFPKRKQVTNVVPAPYGRQRSLASSQPFAQQAPSQTSWKLGCPIQAAEEKGSKGDTASPSINPDWSPARGDVLSSGFGSKPDGDKKRQTGAARWPVQAAARSDGHPETFL